MRICEHPKCKKLRAAYRKYCSPHAERAVREKKEFGLFDNFYRNPEMFELIKEELMKPNPFLKLSGR